MEETQTVYGTFGSADSVTGRSYTEILDTNGIKNGMVMYVTGEPDSSEIEQIIGYFGYETSVSESGPWYTFAEFPIGRLKDGQNYVFKYDLPVLLEVKTIGSWSNGTRDVGTFVHSGSSPNVRILGIPSIFQYVRGYVSDDTIDMDYVIRIY